MMTETGMASEPVPAVVGGRPRHDRARHRLERVVVLERPAVREQQAVTLAR